MIQITMEGAEELQRKLAAIDSPNTRKRILRKLGMTARMNSKKRVTANRPGRPSLRKAEKAA